MCRRGERNNLNVNDKRRMRDEYTNENEVHR